MIQLREQFWAVEVPEGATDFGFINGSLACKLPTSKPGSYHWLHEAEDYMHNSGGVWEIVCTIRDATEEQAESIVQIISNGKISGSPQYRRYDRTGELPARMWTRDPRHSLETLLIYEGCDLGKNWLILKKQ
jgi:hypothetical protein